MNWFTGGALLLGMVRELEQSLEAERVACKAVKDDLKKLKVGQCRRRLTPDFAVDGS